jgi:hypothetical protein
MKTPSGRVVEKVTFNVSREYVREPNEGLYPSGGYVFRETDGVTITSDSWSSLVVAVSAYRVRRKLAPGAPWEEICNQYCASRPHVCSQVWGDRRQPEFNGTTATVISWLADMRAKKNSKELVYVSASEAKTRAAICAKCPMRFEWPSCKSCNKPVEAQRWKCLQGGSKAGMGLGACAKFKVDLDVAVSLDVDYVSSAGVPDVPAACWKI